MNLKEKILNAKIAADFDNTVIKSNSLVIFFKRKLRSAKNVKEKYSAIKKAIKAGVVWGKEITRNFIGFVTGKNDFNDYDSIIRKAKSIKGVAVKELYDIIPYLQINPVFLESFSELKNKLFNKEVINKDKLVDVILTTRNDEDFIENFLKFPANDEIFKRYGLNFIPVGNCFLSNNAVYTGEIKTGKNASLIIKNGDLIDKKTKTELYKSRIVFGDNEEFIALSKKSKAMINVQAKYLIKKQIENAIEKYLELYSKSFLSKQSKSAFLSTYNASINYFE